MANTDGVNIVITGDATQAEKAIKDVSNAIDGVKGADVKITADASQAIGEADKLASTVESINDAHTEITANSSQAVDEANKASDAMENVTDAHAKITADGSQAIDEAGKVADAEENIKDAHTTITADGSQAISELERLEELIFGLDRKKVEFQIKGVIRDSEGRLRDEATGKFLKMGKKAGDAFASGANEGIKGIQQALNSILSLDAGEKISSFFGSIFTGITSIAQRTANVVTTVMKSALSIGGSFEAEITNVKVISGATEEQLDMLIKKAREMGATLPITAKDAATAMKMLAQRGTSVNDILASVADVANLTISQGVDMGSAAELLGSTMTNFSIAIEDANKVTNIFNNASNQSALNMTKLTEAMKYVGPAAGSVGTSLTEAVAAMEAIANAGLTGEMTGTGLAMVLTKLASKSQIMGVRTKELDGSMRPLKDVFMELKEAGFSLSDAVEAFGQRGSKAALALARNSESLEENEKRLQQWGATQAAVDAKAKTFTNTMAALQSAIEELHIEVFEQIKNQSKEAVGGLAELTRSFSAWIGETKIAEKTLNSFLDGLGFKIPSGDDFKRLLKQFDVQSFVDKIKSFGVTIKDIAGSIGNFFSSIKTPLLWLIEHLETFATISFWGWILGKGLQIPAAIMGIVMSFKALYEVGVKVLGLKWASLGSLLISPAGAIVTAVGAGVYAASKIAEANEELRKAVNEEKRYLAEQAKADFNLPIDIQFNFKTGFEKLPESWTKASDELRFEADKTIKDLQDKFRNKVSEAVLAVMAKFPEMADSFKDATGTINQLSTSTLRQISDALHGDEKAFEAMPEHIRKVTEQINVMNMVADEGGMHLLSMFAKYQQVKSELGKPIKQNEQLAFFGELDTQISSVTNELYDEIERAKKFLGGQNGQLAVHVSLAQAQKKLEGFVKTASKKYSISEDIVRAGLFERLERLAQVGDTTAQSLVNGFKGANDTIDTFIQNAQEAMNYLGASPDKFMPALKSLMNGIQKIDPLTGKVTEQFKKAYDTLKQWGKVSFEGLMGRVQQLRKAVEGGFLKKEALEQQIMRVAPKIELQIAKDLYPHREEYGSERNFLAVVASEFSSKIAESFGDVGVKFLQDRFGKTEGATIGSWIIDSVKKQLNVDTGRSEKSDTDLANVLKNLTQTISDTRNAAQQSTDISVQRTDNSASIGQISQDVGKLLASVYGVTDAVNSGVNSLISTIVSVSDKDNTEATNFQNIISALIDNTSALGRTSDAVLSLVNSAGSNTTADYPPDFSLIVGSLQALGGSIDALKNSTDSNVSALSQFQGSLASGVTSPVPQDFSGTLSPVTTALQNISNGIVSVQGVVQANVAAVNAVENAVKATGGGSTTVDISSAINPLTSAVQNLSATLTTIQALQQANASALSDVLNAVRSVESALKSMNAGNSYDIDINQQGFMIEKKSDADMLARSTVNALRAGIGNGGI